MLHSDLRALVISGEPTIQDLSEAWANIYSEYIDKNQGAESKYMFQLESEIIRLYDEIERVDAGLEILSYMVLFPQSDIDRVSSQLRKYGYDYPFPSGDSDTFEANRQHCKNRLASRRYKLQSREAELSDYLKNRKAETIDEHYFPMWIRRLTKYLGVRMRMDNTTVDEFIGYTRDYLDEIKARSQEMENVKMSKRK